MTALSDFRRSLDGSDLPDRLRRGLIGEGLRFETPFGARELLYADYTASGRSLRQVEDFVLERILPFYANSHTEASFCGMTMTRMREEARAMIARLVHADENCHVLFTGSGATAGLNRIVHLLELPRRVAAGESVVVLTGPYEHHSNILPWRESGARVVAVPEVLGGGPDLSRLAEELDAARDADLVVGSFSAASNVTGILTDPDPVTRLLKSRGALAVWDYAGGAPYLPMDMTPAAGCAKDAIVFSPHKFPGGPGASGVTVVRDTIVRSDTPTCPGGGTVDFVSPWRHVYSTRVEAREEGGTPNVIGDIRAALAMLVKDAVGLECIVERDKELRRRGLARLRKCDRIELLGTDTENALPIFSFRVRNNTGGFIHHQLFSRMLSDIHGIQVRGGCACAGPYAHTLLCLNQQQSEDLLRRLSEGEELEKPGWVRLNLSYLLSDEQADRILDAVTRLASQADRWAACYRGEARTARFTASVDRASSPEARRPPAEHAQRLQRTLP
ncbi:aminotransferase class V-fold PLP-dependent enzyme [Tranquillimonas alkanivorans]|uniref:Selenocysteine lyase/Cysteine desulfurase n=1 Tax=Tranquillimonas alkanivorans TaxID=441119 RepID=A0A1I5WIX2_9RHOB|nr:aminotransferase class V-fold PLP-dependent enzyme [Tranquillimonas alkanivorans]SFQ19743.1 Selenocysteine lyase/Cysteine desulfurase [Tranquillimonas alkanivorans]